MTSANQNGTTVLQLVLAWGFVGIPLAWGVAQTITNCDEAVSIKASRLRNCSVRRLRPPHFVFGTSSTASPARYRPHAG